MGNKSRKSPHRLNFGVSFLICVLPVIALLKFWYDHLSRSAYPWIMGLFTAAWLGAVGYGIWFKRRPSASKPPRDFQGDVDHSDLLRLNEYCKSDVEDVHRDQVRLFALSVLASTVVRRRLTDKYVPAKRTLRKTVTVDIDFSRRLALWSAAEESPDAESGTSEPTQVETARNRDPQARSEPKSNTPNRSSDLFIALTLPPKGTLYDDLVIRDAQGRRLSHLSQREYRLLAAKTLRTLLRAAYPGGVLSDAALDAETLALREIIRFARPRKRPRESERQRELREERADAVRAVALNGLRALVDDPEIAVHDFIALAVQFTSQLSNCYAVVVVVPRTEQDRSVITYERNIIPRLHAVRGFSWDAIRNWLQAYIGSMPVTLTVDARNALTCNTYHLLIETPPDLYLGDFDISEIIGSEPEPGPKLEPYWRLRGRRGQHYFHLYTRDLASRYKGQKKGAPVARAWFFEVPPGSIARVAAAALANLFVVLAVGFAMSRAPHDVQPPHLPIVDTQIGAFLLAIPGLAAAWLGFDAKPSDLLDGSLTVRVSSFFTFAVSLTASATLFLQKSGAFPITDQRLFVVGHFDVLWSALVAVAFIHVVAVTASYWSRANYYRRISTKPVEDSAVMGG